jgi:hypothetical protein
MEMTKEELNEIIEKHGKWINGEEDGVFADLSNVDLRGVDLSGVNLSGATLNHADLRFANLSETDLRNADLSGANLSDAKLRGATISRANLSYVNLNDADLRGADLREAYLVGADLRCTDLDGTILNKYMYQITGCGSFSTTTTYDVVNNQVICGCWICDDGNTLENFEKMIEDIYGESGEKPNKKYYQEYMLAINFFKATKKLED